MQLGIGSSGKGVFDWRDLDMLKLNKPIRQAKSLEVKALSIKAAFLYLTTNRVCLWVCWGNKSDYTSPFLSLFLSFAAVSFTLRWLLLSVNLRHHLTCFWVQFYPHIHITFTQTHWHFFFVPGVLCQSGTAQPLSLDQWISITSECEKPQLYTDKDCELYLK